MTSEARDELFENLGVFLRGLFTFSECDGLNHLAEAELTFTQVRTLLMASTSEELPISQIAEFLGMSTTATGRSVDTLVRQGYLERKESAEDRRVKLVTITAAGQAIVDEHISSKSRMVRQFVDQLPVAHLRSFTEALKPIIADGFFSAGREFCLKPAEATKSEES